MPPVLVLMDGDHDFTNPIDLRGPEEGRRYTPAMCLL